MSQPNGGYNHDPRLRARIQALSPDEPGVVFPFSARLARENAWTRGFAARVMEEYRRFLYLAMTAGHPVSPSVAVDQAWHQHLTHTRSYWDELCGRVLGRPLHHDPALGGGAEKQKHADWYARTLGSYRAAFGQEPPRDVWPAPGERFTPAARIRQVSDATHWIVRKPRLPAGLGKAAGGAAALLLAGACAGAGAGGGAVVVLGAIVTLVLIGALAIYDANSARPDPHWPARASARARGRRRARGTGSAASAGDGSGCASYAPSFPLPRPGRWRCGPGELRRRYERRLRRLRRRFRLQRLRRG